MTNNGKNIYIIKLYNTNKIVKSPPGFKNPIPKGFVGNRRLGQLSEFKALIDTLGD